jgi:outer membrane lipoprotein-sorting protein
MENNLRNLKKEMDKKLFKDIPFNRYASIKSVLEGSERPRNSMKRYFHALKSRFPEVISVLICAAILLVLVNVGISKNTISQAEKPAQTKNEMQNNKENETVYVPTPKEELYTEVTKEEILKKIYTSVQNFDTAKGEFHLHYAGGGNPLDLNVQYELNIKQEGGYSLELNNETSNRYYYQKDKLWHVNEQEKYYISETYQRSTIADTEENKKIIDIGKYGDVTVISYPVTPPIGVAKESLFPYELMNNFIDNINDITIENQNEEILGHNTIVLMAKIKNRSIKNMRFWVDKDTGILVKYETYNSPGEIVDYLSPTKLEINVPVDSKKFIPNLEGYTDYNLIRQDQPSMRTGNIDELVPEELKSQWEEAKKKPNETTVLHLNGKWYIIAKKGYLVNHIEVNGTEGILYLSKTSPQKAEYTFHALAENYKVDTLEIVYE